MLGGWFSSFKKSGAGFQLLEQDKAKRFCSLFNNDADRTDVLELSATRSGDLKLVSRLPGEWELYDMTADRTETHDLAKEKPEKVTELVALYQTWAKRAGIKDWVGRQTPVGRNDADMYKK